MSRQDVLKYLWSLSSDDFMNLLRDYVNKTSQTDEKQHFQFFLENVGPNRVEVINTMRSFLPSWTITSLIALLDDVPVQIIPKEDWNSAVALSFVEEMKKVGATVSFR